MKMMETEHLHLVKQNVQAKKNYAIIPHHPKKTKKEPRMERMTKRIKVKPWKRVS